VKNLTVTHELDDTGAPYQSVRRTAGQAESDPVGFLRRRRRNDNLLRFGVPLLIILSWQISAELELLNRRFFPAPSEIWQAMIDSVRSGVLQDAIVSTSQRLFIGYLAGAVIGIFGGFVLGTVRSLRVAFDPVISALYTVPKLAVLPLLLVIFGIGDTPKIILVALGVFFIVVISTTSAVANLPSSYREPAQSFGAGPLQSFRHVTLPAVLPDIFVALRIAAGTAVLLTIGIEFVQGGEGLGWLIWNSWQLFVTDRMYVGIVAVSLLGAVFQGAIKYLGRLLTPWTQAGSSDA
jgi:ABC-type nitrate/sulfonate/bicarbonate transport system permease component